MQTNFMFLNFMIRSQSKKLDFIYDLNPNEQEKKS